MRERARELLPSVLLTLLSVVQALALEALWSALGDKGWLWAGGASAWTGWLQVLAVFQGIVVIWLLYIGVVMRFSWVPATRDAVAPFLLGAGELATISLMEPGLLHWWFVALAGVFVVSARVSQGMFESALAEPENQGAPAVSEKPLERYASFIAAGILVGCGAIAWLADAAPVSVAAVGVANLLLFGQGMMIRRYWRQWAEGL